MIISEAVGDVFNCASHTITCPINTSGAMGKGLAKEFRDRVPGLYSFYLRHYPKGGDASAIANKLQVYPVPDGRQVLLFPTKVFWRDASTIKQVHQNLLLLAQQYQSLNIQSLAIPALGCGEGGLRYEQDVRPLVHAILGPLELPVEVLFYH